MIERIARAIAYEMGDTMGDSEAVFWNGYSYKDSARKAAQAALEAMLEPSEEMIECYINGIEDNNQSPDFYSFHSDGWAAMIKAAIAEG